MKVGLVGLPGSGKTSIFSAFTKSVQESGSEYGRSVSRMVGVPDARLELLRDVYEPQKYTPASIEVHDFPGIDSAAIKGNAALFASIREMDALSVVLRTFEDNSYAHKRPTPNAAADWDALMTEFQVADLEMIERRIERLEVSVKKPTKTQEQDKKELQLLQRCQSTVEEGGRLKDVELKPGEDELIQGFRFLTQKPTMAVLNLDDGEDDADKWNTNWSGGSEETIAIRGRLEAEIAQLDPGEAEEFMRDFSIEEPASNKMVRGLFDLLGLRSFFTVGSDEVRAWTVRKGDDAVVAAAKIHSDIARGFIRAEVVSHDDFVAAGDMKGAKAANTVRLEGKEYEVLDGDIINFRFSV